jgi:hypothetical protein
VQCRRRGFWEETTCADQCPWVCRKSLSGGAAKPQVLRRIFWSTDCAETTGFPHTLRMCAKTSAELALVRDPLFFQVGHKAQELGVLVKRRKMILIAEDRIIGQAHRCTFLEQRQRGHGRRGTTKSGNKRPPTRRAGWAEPVTPANKTLFTEKHVYRQGVLG